MQARCFLNTAIRRLCLVQLSLNMISTGPTECSFILPGWKPLKNNKNKKCTPLRGEPHLNLHLLVKSKDPCAWPLRWCGSSGEPGSLTRDAPSTKTLGCHCAQRKPSPSPALPFHAGPRQLSGRHPGLLKCTRNCVGGGVFSADSGISNDLVVGMKVR